MKQLYSIIGLVIGLALISLISDNFAHFNRGFIPAMGKNYSFAFVNRASLPALNANNDKVRDAGDLTPNYQQENPSDLTITQAIRKALLEDKTLSVNARNVAVVTENGRVTLRGIVDNEQEKSRIEAIAKQAEGVKSVKNELQPPKS
jgi:hypothetical protein